MSTPLKQPTPTKKIKQRIRIIFMGTPEFSLPSLAALAAAKDFEIIGIFTQPDKPIGRKQAITPPPVKQLAVKNGWPVFQPEKIKTEIENIKNLQPNLIVVTAYGKIIPQTILDLPTYGCINVHASLLPKYRGAACLNAPILNGDPETGVTIMKMESGLDTGPILRQAKIQLKGKETLEEVHDRLASLGAELLVPTLRDFIEQKIVPQPQDEARASYVKTLNKEDGRIDWSKPAEEVARLIRAFNPWPGAYSLLKNGKIVKIISAESLDSNFPANYRGTLQFANNQLVIPCGRGALIILKLQLGGGRVLQTKEFLRGHQDLINQQLK